MHRLTGLLVLLSGCASTHLVHFAAPEAPQCLHRVFVFDGVSDARTGPFDVTLSGGLIDRIEPASEQPRPECVDGEGLTLLPGLIDSHAHLGLSAGHAPWDLRLPNPLRQAEMLLMAGVTTAVIAGGSPSVVSVQRQLHAGAAGPTLLRATPIFTAVEGHPTPMVRAVVPWPASAIVRGPMVIEVPDAAAVPSLIDRALRDEPDFVKIVYDAMPPGGPQLSGDLLRALISEAKARGAKAVVHVGSPEEALEAAEAGASLLMHVPWEREFTEAELDQLVATGVPLVSTRRVHAAIVSVLRGDLVLHPLEEAVCPDAQPALSHRPEGYALPGFDEKLLADYDSALGHNVKALFDRGVVVLAGTDSGLPAVFQGASLHRELESLVELGLTPAQVLRSATSVPARVLAPNRGLGVIKRGATADLLLVRGDPLTNIADLEQIVGVWKSGRRVVRNASTD
jgi:imidazolonepropionase-like amidohydrolase